MKEQKNSAIEKLRAVAWAVLCAWEIDKGLILFWGIISIVTALLPSLVVLMSQRIVQLLSQYISTGKNVYYDIFIMVLLRGCTMLLLGLSSRLNSDYIYIKIYDAYYIGMQELLIDNINKLSPEDLLEKEVYDEYDASFTRAGSLTNFLSSFIVLINKVVKVGMLLAVSFLLNRLYFLLFSIYFVCILCINLNFTRRVRCAATKAQSFERISKYYSSAVLLSSIAKEIRMFALEPFIVSKWKEAYSEVIKFDLDRTFQFSFRNLIGNLIFVLLIAIIILNGVFDVYAGQLRVDSFLAALNLCINIKTAMSDVSTVFMETDYGLFSLERQRHFVKDTVPFYLSRKQSMLMPSTQTISDNVVFKAEGLCYDYPNGYRAINNISFEIEEGKIVALVGLNGSGKTTLAKLLLGILHPTQGSLVFKGKPYCEYQKGEISDSISTFFQDVYLFHTSLRDNVAYGDREEFNNNERVINALEEAGIKDMVNELSLGLNSIMGKDVDPTGVELSGGQKQKVAIARAYMGQRRYVIFDEPASKLDPIAELEQFTKIKAQLAEKTAVLISHRMAFARMADKIIVLNKGQIIESGTHEELIARKGIYCKMYSEQARWYELPVSIKEGIINGETD